MLLMRFENKVTVVTGVAKGIGHATAQAFAREGAAVVAVDIDADGLNEAISAIQGGVVRRTGSWPIFPRMRMQTRRCGSG